ncbi:hypothetical protein BKI52_11095 [marine bacterium AO1-C]|nr:hypothetical protein BKI52_11095 [marine bacterium AO1-C]
MTRNIFYISQIILLALASVSCEERIDSALLTGDPVITINGMITNQPGPYYVRITKSVTDLTKTTDRVFLNKFDPVHQAVVTINDDHGNIDTLKPWKVDGEPDWLKGGVYHTTHLQGVVGRTYTLTVVHEGGVYQAVATIPAAPLAIDEVKYAKSKDQINDSRVPLVSFQEPQQQKDYYRFFYRPYGINPVTHELSLIGGYSPGPNNFWQLISPQFFIFDDQLLTTHVVDLKLEDESLTSQELFPPSAHPFGLKTKVEMEIHTITKEAYEYFSAVKENLLFTPNQPFGTAPASPPTNISNGGLGFFTASSSLSVLVDGPQN